MPCLYCLSRDHSIRTCDADHMECVGQIMTQLFQIKYKFREQLEVLKEVRNGDLAIMCKFIGMRYTGTKRVLSLRIMKWSAERHVRDAFSISPEEEDTLEEELIYASVRVNADLEVQTLVERVFSIASMLNNGRRDWQQPAQQQQQQQQQEQEEQQEQEQQQQIQRVQNEWRQRIQEAIRKKKPVTMHIVPTSNVQECGICYEEKDALHFGCDHSFCVGCTAGILKTNRKCAFCRVDLTEVHGGQEQLTELALMHMQNIGSGSCN